MVNKHRQSTLVTYRAFVEAAGVKGNSESSLHLCTSKNRLHQRQTAGRGTAKSVVEVLVKPLPAAE
jgi:hypothetical protein